MKHLRRNRSTSISTPSASSSNNPPSVSVSAPAPLSARAAATAAAERTSHETPLYARFAGARRAPDGSGPALKPLVSGPLALAPRKVVQVQAQVSVAAPVSAPGPVQAPAMKQQKSSGSEGRERNPRGEMDKTKERAEMSRDKQLKVRDEAHAERRHRALRREHERGRAGTARHARRRRPRPAPRAESDAQAGGHRDDLRFGLLVAA
ncbi:hypothetical protein ONZ51_g11486 [Trametes cubensis]|uniref:Uncharacterized protein n=1 Tax=Trametes cubensis TaxID=1111947 RepID=A0AAD7TKA2_9APHY|nr:hypothetical protein ONZ51_g11486 [Trametes cubensis]